MSHACGSCGANNWKTATEQPDSGTGCIIALLGLLLAPVLIGIPVIVYGVRLQSRQETWRVCGSCGGRIPVETESAGTQNIGWWILAAVLGALFILAVGIFFLLPVL